MLVSASYVRARERADPSLFWEFEREEEEAAFSDKCRSVQTS